MASIINNNLNNIKFPQFQLYSTNSPLVGEYVDCEINDKVGYTHFDITVPTYNIKGMLPFKNSSKRRKVDSWNQIVKKWEKINARSKVFIVRVDEITNDIATVNKVYCDNESKEYKNKKHALLKLEMLKNIFLKMCNILNKKEYNIQFNIEDEWKKIIYPFDESRRKENSNISLYDYIFENQENVEKFKSQVNENVRYVIDEIIQKDIETYVFKFSLRSNGSVVLIRKFLNDIVSNIDDKDVNVRLIKTSEFQIENLKNNNTEHIDIICSKLLNTEEYSNLKYQKLN